MENYKHQRRDYTLEEVKQIISLQKGSKAAAVALAKKLNRSYYGLAWLRSSYTRFLKNPNNKILSKALRELFIQAHKDLNIDLPDLSSVPEDPNANFRKRLTVETIIDLVKVEEGKMTKEGFMVKHQKTAKRVDFLLLYHKVWLKKRESWANNGNVTKLFEEYHNGNNGIAKPEANVEQPKDEPEVAVYKSQIVVAVPNVPVDSYSELDHLVTDFEKNLSEVISKIITDETKKKVEIAKQEGYQEGIKMGEANYRKQTISSMVLNRLFKKD